MVMTVGARLQAAIDGNIIFRIMLVCPKPLKMAEVKKWL